MKRLLSIIGAISLIGTSTTSLVACNKPQYSEDELKKEKEKHKIDTKYQTIRDNLEWIASQELPFNKIDNKYYYVVWRGDKSNDWKMVKFKHFEQKEKVLDKHDKYELKTSYKNGFVSYDWNKDNGTYFKSVYRWNLNIKEPDLLIDSNGSLKVKVE